MGVGVSKGSLVSRSLPFIEATLLLLPVFNTERFINTLRLQFLGWDSRGRGLFLARIGSVSDGILLAFYIDLLSISGSQHRLGSIDVSHR